MRRKRWRPPNDPMPQARFIWKAVHDRPWPTGWKVKWVGFMRNCWGLTKWGTKEILLSYGDAKRADGHAIDTLLHEFVHVRFPKLRHGREFDRLVAWSKAQLGASHVDAETTAKDQERDTDPTGPASPVRFSPRAGDFPAVCRQSPTP